MFNDRKFVIIYDEDYFSEYVVVNAFLGKYVENSYSK